MTAETDSRHSRREFLGWLARGAALAGLGAVAAVTLLKECPYGDGPEDPRADPALCRACPRLDRCRLPQAAAAREAPLRT